MGADIGGAYVTRFLNQLWIVIGVAVAAFIGSWIYYMPSSDVRGVWRLDSGGVIVSITPLRAKMYTETAVSCTLDLSFPAHMKLVEMSEGATIEVVDTQLLLQLDSTLGPMHLNRIDALPDTCTTPDHNATAREVFDAVWHAMNDNYAFFDLHGIDWDARRALAPTGADRLNMNGLFDILTGLLEGIDDGHVFLASPIDVFTPAQPPAWLIDGLTRQSLTETARAAVGDDLTPVAETGIEYTLMPDGIGYVLINHMSLATPFGTKSQPAMALAFAEVADALTDAETIIIDLRYNPGGSDTVAFGIASHFTSTPLDVLTKTTHSGDGETAPFTATVLPFDDTPLSQPLIVLTSQLTGSAAEILTLALRELDRTTLMGERTSGGFSDIMGVKLPNGWDLGLSNQTYRSMDGEVFEGVGIPPDVPFTIEADPLLGGEDPLLRAAFARARDGR